jgi:hypothetical protein
MGLLETYVNAVHAAGRPHVFLRETHVAPALDCSIDRAVLDAMRQELQEAMTCVRCEFLDDRIWKLWIPDVPCYAPRASWVDISVEDLTKSLVGAMEEVAEEGWSTLEASWPELVKYHLPKNEFKVFYEHLTPTWKTEIHARVVGALRAQGFVVENPDKGDVVISF